MQELLQENKVYYNNIDFEHKDNEMIFRCNELYNKDTCSTIAGASLLYRSVLSIDYTYHSFALRLRNGSNTNIIVQLEVEPYNPKKPSHRENGKAFYGSHLLKAQITTEYGRHTDNWRWNDWLKEFHNQANIEFLGNSMIPPSFTGDLFS